MLQENVGRLETSRLAIAAGPIVSVVTQVGHNERVVGRTVDGPQRILEPGERHNAPLARRRIDNGVKIDEWIVFRRVLVAWCGLFGHVGSAHLRVRTRRRLAAWGGCR